MQNLKSEFTILGAKFFKDTVEGTAYDSTTLFVVMPVDDSTGRSVGTNTKDMKFGTSDEYHKLKHLPFPLQAELTYDLVTNGKAVTMLIKGFKPIQAVKPAAGA